ncbi:hypothetical protein [Streptomyces reticuli]|uniref:hypothetical protein n=1 Tax=Streptomyces reticuli TaxID=1926 RepID=UPI00073DDCFA|nr:hypothetical protein [Streptomyces sp. SID7810]CUW31796.1 hypothetical protein TUE45_06545 [Streptomyces reticuli]
MPVPDDYGQGINIASLTDAPDAEKLAKEIANALAKRGVMSFASASARGATIPAPTEGMLTWIRDADRLDLYDGGAWVTVSVGNRAWTTIALSSGWAQNGNSQGTFQYRIVNFAGEDTIMFRGGISRSSYPSSMPSSFTLNASSLPASARPSTLRTIVVPCSDVNSDRITLKLDITPSGDLNLFGTSSTAKPPWVGFNGCFASL